MPATTCERGAAECYEIVRLRRCVRAIFHLSHAQAIETAPLLRAQVVHVVRSKARHVGTARGRMRRRPRFH
eukprot:4789522-Prymnesium_polylepis.1